MKYILFTLVLFFTVNLSAQDNVDPWNILAMVDKESKFDDLLGMIIQTATPKPVVEPLNGKEMTIKGHIIALAAKTELSHFMFSRYPQNMCFFCGAAGPESAMQVFMKDGEKINYTSDKVILKGILNIQKGDPSGLIYTLTDAELLEIVKS
ncbi:MAG: hypothetical protein HKO66_11910 [Saprospiraceae bacterium]|nr:hypothetical protein [Bacteroidia bacterium]NNE13583.1 hypothetical protein [Saprospiraceae bacterium]NNL92934.1 hypothetical protein [Saprospiraceae bacterium]